MTLDPAELAITRALRAAIKDGLSGAELAKATGMGSAPLYRALVRMEADGRVTSAWVDGPYPRRRLYRLGRGPSRKLAIPAASHGM